MVVVLVIPSVHYVTGFSSFDRQFCQGALWFCVLNSCMPESLLCKGTKWELMVHRTEQGPPNDKRVPAAVSFIVHLSAL